MRNVSGGVYECLGVSAVADRLYADEYASWHNNWPAAVALAKWLEELSWDLGEPLELDVVALRCDWSMYDASELVWEFDSLREDVDAGDENEVDALADLIRDDGRAVIKVDNQCYLVQD